MRRAHASLILSNGVVFLFSALHHPYGPFTVLYRICGFTFVRRTLSVLSFANIACTEREWLWS